MVFLTCSGQNCCNNEARLVHGTHIFEGQRLKPAWLLRIGIFNRFPGSCQLSRCTGRSRGGVHVVCSQGMSNKPSMRLPSTLVTLVRPLYRSFNCWNSCRWECSSHHFIHSTVSAGMTRGALGYDQTSGVNHHTATTNMGTQMFKPKLHMLTATRSDSSSSRSNRKGNPVPNMSSRCSWEICPLSWWTEIRFNQRLIH